MISLQGFLNFCGFDARLRKIRLQNLAKVRKQIEENYLQAILEFQKVCGCLGLSNNVPKEVLLKDLEMMHKEYHFNGPKTLVLGTEEDMIVPMSLIKDNFSEISLVKIIQLKGCGHSLGFSLADEVSKLIINFIGATDHDK